MYGERCIGSLYHYGIKGQKWGVRRSPEQLGHTKPKMVEKPKESVILKEGFYISKSKGISAHENKFDKYLLDPRKPHSQEFFDAGYTLNDAKKLFEDICDNFDISKAIIDSDANVRTCEKFSIPMKLGTNGNRTFRSVWDNNGIDGTYRLITAYIDRRLKEDE